MEEKKQTSETELQSEISADTEAPSEGRASTKQSSDKKRGIKLGIIILAIAAVVIIAVILAIILGGGSNGWNNNSGNSTNSGEGGSNGADGSNGAGGNGDGSGGIGGSGEEESVSYTKELCFELNSDGNYVVSVGDARGISKIIIPEEYKGRPVVAIKHSGFYECDGIVSITIPSTITKIDTAAFYNCFRLIEVINHSSLDITKEGIYHGNLGLYALDIHSGESKLVEQDGFLFYTVGGVNYVVGYEGDSTSLVLPEKYNGQSYVINNYAFFKSILIESLTIPEGITTIGDYAFSRCLSLKEVVIPDSVTTLGQYAFYCCQWLDSVKIGRGITEIKEGTFAFCYSLDSVEFSESLTAIRQCAFDSCLSLRGITVPKNVTAIENYAFRDCYNLVEIINKSSLDIKTIADYDFILFGSYHGGIGDHALVVHSGESQLVNQNGLFFITAYDTNYLIGYDDDTTELTLPDYYNGQTYRIRNYAFYNLHSLRSVVIGEGVEIIGSSAFINCYHLVEVINKSAIPINNSFSYSGTIAPNVIEVHQGESKIVEQDGFLFYTRDYTGVNYLVGYAGNATNITLPDSLNGESYEIYKSAFSNCYSLESVTIPDGVTAIGDSAFYLCCNLKNITIGNGVTEIGSAAFSSCYRLKEITFGSGVTEVGGEAFRDCKSLRRVNIHDIASWCETDFAGGLANPLSLGGKLYLNNHLITDLVIPEGVTRIGRCSFYGYGELTSVVIADSVEIIEKHAFTGCLSLKKAVIGNGVTTIGREAFSSCESLMSITLGSSVSDIHDEAFSFCQKIREVINKSSLNIVAGSSDYGGVAINAVDVHDGESKIVEQNGFYFYTIGGVNYLICYLGDSANVVLPESYNGQSYEIFKRAFCDSLSMESIIIPDSVTSIGDRAFQDCHYLQNVYYTGSEEAWKNIPVGTGNERLENATIHYNYIPEE